MAFPPAPRQGVLNVCCPPVDAHREPLGVPRHQGLGGREECTLLEAGLPVCPAARRAGLPRAGAAEHQARVKGVNAWSPPAVARVH